VDGAARVYFGTSARKLTLAQGRDAGDPDRAPSVFSPRRDLLRAQQRATLVLDSMVDNGAITEEQAAEARAHPAQIIDRVSLDARNYFLDSAADEATRLATMNGVAPSSDMVVHTTLEPKVQEAARLAALRHHQQIRQENPHQPGRGGDDEAGRRGQRHDRRRRLPRLGVQPRHPGASPAWLGLQALCLSGGAGGRSFALGDAATDEAVDIGGYHPTNFGGKYYGHAHPGRRVAHSVNTITVNLAQEVGVPKGGSRRQAAWHHSPLEANASLALGHQRSDTNGTDCRLCGFRQWRYRVSPYLVTQVDIGNRLSISAISRHRRAVIDEAVDRDLDRHVVQGGDQRHRRLRLAAWTRSCRQDRHHPGFP
jgi:penicillin-binding protein 1A